MVAAWLKAPSLTHRRACCCQEAVLLSRRAQPRRQYRHGRCFWHCCWCTLPPRWWRLLLPLLHLLLPRQLLLLGVAVHGPCAAAVRQAWLQQLAGPRCQAGSGGVMGVVVVVLLRVCVHGGTLLLLCRGREEQRASDPTISARSGELELLRAREEEP
jgi:hypothetical protein